MIRPLAFHWHRFMEWFRGLLARRAFARGRRHFDRSRWHGAEADRLDPPLGPNNRPPPEAAPLEWEPRREERAHDDPFAQLN